MPESLYVRKDAIPSSLYLNDEIVYENKFRPIPGGFSSVYRGHLAGQPGNAVAVKRLVYTGEDDDKDAMMDRAFEKEVTVLMYAKHPYILTFLGLVELAGNPCIVTPWAANGTVRKYLGCNPTADREKIIIEVASALEYLHSGAALPDGSIVVHGDIHSSNVLIGADGSALLCDFGISKRVLPGQMASLSLRMAGPQGMIAYAAPELHDWGVLRTVESDVFSFGMLAYEVSGGEPSSIGPTYKAIKARLQAGQRPLRVERMRDQLWGIISDCWKGMPTERPTMKDLCARLAVVH